MPTINLEMMKQLLEEFSEKEALTTEEITIIENEITSLEERVIYCRNKLQNLGADKERLTAMKERYVKGNFAQYTQASPALPEGSTVPALSSKLAPGRPASSPIKSLNSRKATHPDLISSTDDEPAAEEKTVEIALPSQTQIAASSPNKNETSAQENSTEPDNLTQEGATNETSSDKEGNKPISINEALKGLFRK
jgi:hypothetical protein